MLRRSAPEPWISSGEALGWSALVARTANMGSYKLIGENADRISYSWKHGALAEI